MIADNFGNVFASTDNLNKEDPKDQDSVSKGEETWTATVLVYE